MKFAGFLDSGFAAVVDIVVVLDDFSTDEATLKVAVDHTSALRSLAAATESPRAHLLGASGEEGLEVQQGIGRLDDSVHTALLQPDFRQEHLALLVVLEFSNFALGLGCDYQNLGILVLDGLAHRVHIGVAIDNALIVHVADIHHGLVGQQEQLMSNLFLILVEQFHGAGATTLLQCFLVTLQNLILHLGLTVATGLSLFLHTVDAALDGLQVTQLQLQVDDLLVADGIHGTIDVSHIIVVKAAQHVNDGISLTDIAQELVAKALATASALHQSSDIDNLDRGGHDASRIHQFGKLIEALVGHRDDTHVRLDGAERKVSRLRLGIRQTIEQG